MWANWDTSERCVQCNQIKGNLPRLICSCNQFFFLSSSFFVFFARVRHGAGSLASRGGSGRPMKMRFCVATDTDRLHLTG